VENVVTENVVNLILESGMTYEEIARKAGYKGHSSIAKIMSGESRVPRPKYKAFAEIFGVTVAELCGYDADTENDTDDGSNGYDLEVLANRLRKNEFEAVVFATSKEAVEYIVQRCDTQSVGIASSTAIKTMGLLERLQSEEGVNLHANDLNKSRDSKKSAITSNVYILSINGIAYDVGDMVVISADGSRIAGSTYYADEVFFIVSRNKVAPNIDKARLRAKENRPLTAKMRGYKTPCVEKGECENCHAHDCACRFSIEYRMADKKVNMVVVLIDEDLGL
jgi:transcriptional regulator with XRE-family HTH domain